MNNVFPFLFIFSKNFPIISMIFFPLRQITFTLHLRQEHATCLDSHQGSRHQQKGLCSHWTNLADSQFLQLFFFLNNVKRVMRRKKKQKKPVQLRLWPTKSEIAPILCLRKLADPSPAIPVLLSLAMFIIASWYASSTSSWVTTSLILFHFSG